MLPFQELCILSSKYQQEDYSHWYSLQPKEDNIGYITTYSGRERKRRRSEGCACMKIKFKIWKGGNFTSGAIQYGLPLKESIEEEEFIWSRTNNNSEIISIRNQKATKIEKNYFLKLSKVYTLHKFYNIIA